MKKWYWIGGLSILFLAIFYELVNLRIDSDSTSVKTGNTLAVLNVCGAALETWAKAHHRIPTEQEGLGVLKMKILRPTDGWDRPIIYKTVEADGVHKFLLYSLGPNGIDENGSGDDLVFDYNDD